jgi:hypothetical protein
LHSSTCLKPVNDLPQPGNPALNLLYAYRKPVSYLFQTRFKPVIHYSPQTCSKHVLNLFTSRKNQKRTRW